MHREDIAKLAPVRPGAGGVRSRFLFFFFFAPSTQGERARLLTGNEAGSIPAGRANSMPACSGNDADSKPAKERSIRLRRCQQDMVRWSKGEAPACKAGPCRFESGSHLHFHGGLGELENTARRERVTTGSIPVGHPNFAGIVQWQDSRPVSGRRRFDSILPAPDDCGLVQWQDGAL